MLVTDKKVKRTLSEHFPEKVATPIDQYARKIHHIHQADVCSYAKLILSWDVLQTLPYLGCRTLHFTITIADKSMLSIECLVYSAFESSEEGALG